MNPREFKNCLGRVTKSSRLVELQFNRPYDIENDLWYKINQDFLTDEWTNSIEYTTVTKQFSGDSIDKDYVDSMKMGLNFVFKEAYNKSFYLELMKIWEEGEDRWLQMCNGGLNVRVTVFLTEDVWFRHTYPCASPMPSSVPFVQDATNEKTFEMPVTLNFGISVLENHGMYDSLPVGIEAIVGNSLVTSTGTELTITLSDIQGDTALIADNVANPFRVMVYDGDGYITTSDLVETIPGTYVATVDVGTPGVYLVNTVYIATSTGSTLSFTKITEETYTLS